MTAVNRTGGTESHALSGTGRYVRMYGTERGTPYGYSLWEFKVFGSGCTVTTTPPATTPSATTPPTTTPPTTTPPATTPPATTPPTTTPPATTPPTTAPPAGTAWAPNTVYAVNAVVTYNGVSYLCRQAHRSLNGWEPPNVPALWLQL